jgi:hypothetical protein
VQHGSTLGRWAEIADPEFNLQPESGLLKTIGLALWQFVRFRVWK